MSTDDGGERPAAGSEPTDEDHAKMRRDGNARRAVSESVVFYANDKTVEGWALNISNGGLRAVLEGEGVAVGDELEVAVGDAARRAARVVWVRPSKGGAIVGFAFVGADSAPPPPPSMPPPGFDLSAFGLDDDTDSPHE